MSYKRALAFVASCAVVLWAVCAWAVLILVPMSDVPDSTYHIWLWGAAVLSTVAIFALAYIVSTTWPKK